jgi:ABC-type Zn uptake system ZnuABC Zn-binding protein ZnuA
MRLVLLALVLCLVTACRPAATPASRKLNVLTSILPVYCLTASVAGDLAEVEPARRRR